MILNPAIYRAMIHRARAALAGVALLLAAVAGVAQQTALRQTDPQAAVFPLTTKSPEARRLVEEGMRLFLGHFERGKGLETLRSALQIDPKFAIGHQFLAVISLDSAEQVSEQE